VLLVPHLDNEKIEKLKENPFLGEELGNKIFARRTLSPLQATGYYGRACTPLWGGRKNYKTS
jgi:hypothetical protein